MPVLRRTVKYGGTLLIGAVLCACALTQLQFQPDLRARAPAIDGFGVTTMPVASQSAQAQRLFQQGMAQAYGFNDAESVRAFKAALAQDPHCVMCAWGVAYQLGPNINRSRNQQVAEAARYVAYARRRAGNATALERGLIDALARRYATGVLASQIVVDMAPMCASGGRGGAIDPLDMAYAVSMRQLADQYPDNPDVQALYAEAEMIATPKPKWDEKSPKAGARMAEVATRVEQALRRHPHHVGLNHYMIHAVDVTKEASRGEPAADRLASLAPASPHLLHMPSHVFTRVGRYSDAASVNRAALVAEDAFDATLVAQNFTSLYDWRPHNTDFLVFGLIMSGQGDNALAVARSDATKATGDSDYGEFRRSRPLLTLLRLERWADILAEPRPKGEQGVAAIVHLHTRGTALARTGDQPGTAALLTQLQARVAALLTTHTSDGFGHRMMRGVAQVSLEHLSAEVASGQGRDDAALAHLVAAEKANQVLDTAEPPMLAGSARLSLGQLQLKLRQWSAAEATFRRDLVANPNSGWAYRGLAQALRGQGRNAEARQAQADLARAWPQADRLLTAAR